MVRLEVAAIYVGANILLLLLLGISVTLARRRHKISFGDNGADAMTRIMRAHGNAAEYIPAALVGLLTLSLLDPAAPLWLVHTAGISLTAGRVLHAIGLYTGQRNLGRVLGMTLTWLSYLLIGGGLLYAGLAQQV